jgi:protein gp37
MSDLFHKDVPDDFIKRCFDVMREASQHKFQVLTKRPKRVKEIAKDLDWAPNVWMGTSVENAKTVERVRLLQKIPASVRFLSVEPLLGPVKRLPLKGIHWVIVGGESGPKSRPMDAEWVRNVRDQCIKAEVPFFFKQWGAYGADGVRRSKKANGRELDGQIWSEMPNE